ncbi:hypothetical protein CBR_g8830 [Chara braunii]|uniref:Uncharacterized protein n=1 Tax=Chara braunii TaxID=69332 RepID=A0A388KMY1_CHABU|nr:hypothetical protein CBR_g8830 [Chara braunii]|eukprot:GBG71410.1 hypothetical protein CBR_g8830 [Chara braunii]
MPVDVKDGVSVVLPEDGAWTELEPAYQTVMLEGEDAFLWIETVWANVSLTRLSPSLMDLEFRGTVEARGWVYLSQDGENAMVVELVLGNTPDELFRKAEAEVVCVACQRREMEMERVDVRVELGDRGSMRRPVRTMRCVLPPFLVDAVFGTRSRLDLGEKLKEAPGKIQGKRTLMVEMEIGMEMIMEMGNGNGGRGGRISDEENLLPIDAAMSMSKCTTPAFTLLRKHKRRCIKSKSHSGDGKTDWKHMAQSLSEFSMGKQGSSRLVIIPKEKVESARIKHIVKTHHAEGGKTWR